MQASRDARLATLREQARDKKVVDAIEALLQDGADADLHRINVPAFAASRGLDEDEVIDAFLHASKLGLFELVWNLCCPGCGGVLDASHTLKTVRPDAYACSLCVQKYEPNLDELVEASFTVSPAVRKIGAHDPDTLSLPEYYRQMYFSSVVRVPPAAEWESIASKFSIEQEEVPAREKVALTVHLPAEHLALFEPVTHSTIFFEMVGEPTRDRREVSAVYTSNGCAISQTQLAPGPIKLTIDNRTDRRILPAIFRLTDELHIFMDTRQSYLTAKRLVSTQTFRDLYRTDTLDVDQRLKITSLTVLFTDLLGSTEMYDRVGDLTAYDLVKSHFRVLNEAIRTHGGAVVKTIGDAVMATFPTPERGLGAALSMRRSMDAFNRAQKHDDLIVKIGLHEGPCLAVMSNERLDYFGQTVNIAARVQGLATSRTIFATEPVVKSPRVADLLGIENISPTPRRATLKGIKEEVVVYEIP